MPKLTENRVPSYRRHKQSGQAVVTLNGRDVLLGKHNSAASKSLYNQRISEWIAAGRQNPAPAADLSITELIARYNVHVEAYYRSPTGKPTGEADNIRHALRPLRKLYGALPAADFSLLKLEAVREAMIDPKVLDPNATGRGWCRRLVNQNIFRIINMFRWACSKELLKGSVLVDLQTVASLKWGRTEARESAPVMPVDDAVVDATVPFLTSTVAAMVKFQRLTGTRPGETSQLRTMDIDVSGKIWIYKPAQHKNQHRGRQRTISIGPRAQLILQPFLKPLNPTAYIFDPADSVAEMRERRAAARKTPANQGNRAGANLKRSPAKKIGDRYTAASFRKAIARACDAAFPGAAGSIGRCKGPS